MPFKGVFEDNGKIVSYLDELRYFIMTRPRPAEREQTSAPVLADKMRKIKRLTRGRKRI